MFRYIKEIVKDMYSAFRVGLSSMRINWKANRLYLKNEIRHEKLVEEKGHCGAFIHELETNMDILTDDTIKECIEGFVKWTSEATEWSPDYEGVYPRDEDQWSEVLDYCKSFNINIELEYPSGQRGKT